MRKNKKRPAALLLCAALIFSLSACGSSSAASEEGAEEITSSEPRIAATSIACMEVCQALDLDLVAVPHSDISEIPERYSEAVSLGSPMSPDMEILAQCAPDWVLSPSSLISDLQPKYEEAGLQYAFLNLKSVKGMYKSIEELGEIFNRQEQAQKLIDEFEAYYQDYTASHAGQVGPTVLVLMGLPGSYVVATENSYVGSLVEMAGGINVYVGTEEEFLNVNTEDMLKKDPDIILRTAHAMPDSVMEMFAEEFESNDIWKHFRAVQEGKVYDLPYSSCGMSANFNYPDALEILDGYLFSNSGGTQ